MPRNMDILYVLLTGVMSFIGQSLMNLSLQVEEAGTVSLVRKADDILLAFVIQIAYFGDIPTLVPSAGAIMITAAVILAGARKIASEKSRSRGLRRVLCLPQLEPDEENGDS